MTLTAVSGKARISEPHRTIRASAIATVRGSLSTKRVMRPGSVSTWISPLSRLTLVRTTSRPIPRPDVRVTADAVLKPVTNIRFKASRSESAAASADGSRPRSTARRRSSSASIPRPSSSTSTSTNPPAWEAERVRRPSAGLPTRSRSSGVSMPWPIAFWIRWRSGSATCSITLLSTSAVSPRTVKPTTLPVARAASRTCCATRVKSRPIGTMRARVISLRSAAVSRWIWAVSSPMPRSRVACWLWTSPTSADISATLRARMLTSSYRSNSRSANTSERSRWTPMSLPGESAALGVRGARVAR